MTAGLEGKVAVVTGGGSGLGEAIARRLGANGCTVVVAGRRRPPLDAVAAAIGGLAVTTDIRDEAQVQALFGACEAAYGRLDVLVNNAGITGPTAPAEEMDAAAWDETFAVNARGTLLCIKHAMGLLRSGGGAIVNMSSRVGLYGKPARSAYAASKFAICAITESVAAEAGRWGVRVNSVCPGGVDTALFRSVVTARAEKKGVATDALLKAEYLDSAALGRLVSADDVADAVMFLAGAEAAAITGEHILVDAGRS
ncbi:MAG: SDR family NAD(P)-dependent oxidoreductase [Rhodospirillales bacterium]|nr:SDR family NAD(P)-dependent oxidoreductase [Rhodospirillales bacterium]